MGRKRKNKKNRALDIELALSSEEVLEFIEWLDYAREGKETWCASAGQVHAQLKELVLARLEQRKPRAVLGDKIVMPVDNDRLSKLAFGPGVSRFSEAELRSSEPNGTVQAKLDAGLYASQRPRPIEAVIFGSTNNGTTIVVDDGQVQEAHEKADDPLDDEAN